MLVTVCVQLMADPVLTTHAESDERAAVERKGEAHRTGKGAWLHQEWKLWLLWSKGKLLADSALLNAPLPAL